MWDLIFDFYAEGTDTMTSEPDINGKKKTRSRKGCHNCKKSKIKCDELKPSCSNCTKYAKACDYSIKLTWGGRPYKVPKIEKMNPVANLQRTIHVQDIDNLNRDISATLVASRDDVSLGESTEIKVKLEPETIKVNLEQEAVREAPGDVLIKEEPRRVPESTSIKSVHQSSLHAQPLHSSISVEINNNINSLSNVLDNILNEDVFQNHDMMNRLTSINSNLSPLNSLMNDSYDSFNNNANFTNVNDNPQLMNVQSPHYNLMLDDNANGISHMNSIMPLEPNNNNESFLELMGEYSEDLAKSEAVINKSSGTIFSIPLRFSSKFQSVAPTRQGTFDNDDEDDEDEFATTSLDDELSSLVGTPQSHELVQLMSSTIDHRNVNNIQNFSHDQELVPTPKDNLLKHFSTIASPALSASSSEQDAIETIPRGISPLPDILLNVPYYYDHFQFYLNTTAEILIPVHPSIYNNPFKVVLPKLAMSNDILMCLLIAYGISHKSYLKQEEAPKEIVDQLISRTMSELLKLLRDKSTATSDLTLSVVMLLSSYMGTVSKGEKWKIHLKGAKQILLMRGYKKPFAKLIKDMKHLTDTKPSFTTGTLSNSLEVDGELKESRLLFFMVRWYAFIDVLASLASPLTPTQEMVNSYANGTLSLFDSDEILHEYGGDSPESERTHSTTSEVRDSPMAFSSRSPSMISTNNGLPPNTTKKSSHIDYQLEDESSMSKNILLQSESFSEIDYFLGFNIKFLPLYTKIIQLIEKINIAKEYEKLMNNNFTIDPYVITKALEIINKFDKLDNFQNQLNSLDTSSLPDSKKDRMRAVIASNHIFAMMGKLSIYRRVLGISRNSSIIQDICNDSQSVIERYIPEGSSTDLCGLFPIFVTGCEIISKRGRQFFKSRLQSLGKNASPGAHLGLEVMQRSWDDDCNWYDIFPPDRKTHFIFL